MRKRTMLIMIMLLVISAIVIFIIDNKLYYHGRNDFGMHNELPFKIVPKYWGYDKGMLGFVLVQDGETVVANGMRYWDDPNVKINEILKYGFNKERLVALVNNSVGHEYYVICEKPVDTNSKQKLKITVVPQEEFKSKEQFNWVMIKNVSTEKMELVRNYTEIFFLLLALLAVYNLFTEKDNAPN